MTSDPLVTLTQASTGQAKKTRQIINVMQDLGKEAYVRNQYFMKQRERT
jgi:hypothetical protein